MSTRSQVIRQTPDGFRGIYIHCDGYPSCRGVECLAAKLAGKFDKFLDDNRRDWNDDYEYSSIDEIVTYARHSDLEYVYILMSDGTWTVLDIGIGCNRDYTEFENNVRIITGNDDVLRAYIAEESGWTTDRVIDEVALEMKQYAEI